MWVRYPKEIQQLNTIFFLAHAELKKKHDSIHQLKSELKISSEISAKLKLSEEQNKKLKNDVEMKEEEISRYVHNIIIRFFFLVKSKGNIYYYFFVNF